MLFRVHFCLVVIAKGTGEETMTTSLIDLVIAVQAEQL